MHVSSSCVHWTGELVHAALPRCDATATLSAVAVCTCILGTEATKRSVRTLSPASPSGMVTRRMRQQAELRKGVRVVERGCERGGEGGVESRDEGSSLPAVHIQVDEDQEMDIVCEVSMLLGFKYNTHGLFFLDHFT